MKKSRTNQVIIYHDETKDVKDVAGKNYKGHILFFVPIKLAVATDLPLFGLDITEYAPHQLLYEKILELRTKFCCEGKLHFSQLSGKTWKKYDFAYRYAVDVTVDGLRHKHQKEFPYPLNCKMAIIFYPKGADWSMYGGSEKKEQKLRHDETLLRILLKGAAHFLYNEDNRIEVKKIITDGMPSHRILDTDRIIQTLTYEDYHGRTSLRDYVTFSNDVSIIHLQSDHKKYSKDTEDYMDANLLQVTDLLLGATIRSCYQGIRLIPKIPRIDEECDKRDVISYSVKEMLDKRMRLSGFKNSGHYRSFSISEVSFSKDSVNFKEVHSIEPSDLDQESKQKDLFNKNCA